jgi:hypothetical protein
LSTTYDINKALREGLLKSIEAEIKLLQRRKKPGFPLGMIAGADCQESQIWYAPGECLSMCTTPIVKI